MAENHTHAVVEIVGHPSRPDDHGFHLLSLLKLSLKLIFFGLGTFTIRDVAKKQASWFVRAERPSHRSTSRLVCPMLENGRLARLGDLGKERQRLIVRPSGKYLPRGTPHDGFRLQTNQTLKRRVDRQEKIIHRLARFIADNLVQGKPIKHLAEQHLVLLLSKAVSGHITADREHRLHRPLGVSLRHEPNVEDAWPLRAVF